jgi:hypothetical protein
MRIVAILLCAVCFGCGGGVTGPSVPIDEPFTLGVNEAKVISGTPLAIQFTGVTDDSRCPADAVCIQGGDAVVHIRVEDGGTSRYELHTGDLALSAVAHGRFRISLVDLQPYPFSSRSISPGEYRATLTVTRL